MVNKLIESKSRIHRVVQSAALAAMLVAVSSTNALLLDTTNLVGGNYAPSANLTLLAAPSGLSGRVDLQPDMPAMVNAFSGLAQAAFNADRAGQFPGWNFTVQNAAGLAGTIRFDRYVARDIPGEVFGRGGATMNATYVPGAGDPANLAWVNFFEDNVGGQRIHIDPFPNDDLGPGGGSEGMPFYLNTNEGIGNLNFVDNPSDRVTSIPFDRFVMFESYLVGYDPAEVNDGMDGGTINVFGGFAWGYHILVLPTPGSGGLLIAGLIGFAFLLRRRRGGNHAT